MKKNISKEKPISLKFLFFVFAVVLAIFFYVSYPSNISKMNEKKSFEEMLEYNQFEKEQTYIPEYLRKKQLEILPDSLKKVKIPPLSDSYVIQAQKDSTILPSSEKIVLYNQLLDELSQYPPKSELSIHNITNRLISFKGYPINMVDIVISKSDENLSSINSFMFANFNFATGEMHISQRLLYELDIRMIIAIIAHELDHFDKLAQLCKSLGIDEFDKIFTDNGVNNLNKSFWEKAASYADINYFETGLYSNALKRFLTQKDLERTSSYADFYRLAENMRNPLEISAYKESDYVYNHFNIPVVESDMKRISDIFNKIDWAIYELVDNKPILKHERIALFDYFFAHAIIDTISELKDEFDVCVNQKNGDLTSFWLEFEGRYSSFYKQNKMSKAVYNDMYAILNTVNKKITKNITPNEIANAIQYKMNTLRSNLVYPNAVDYLRKTTVNYLKYINDEKIKNPSQELEAILILFCIDNHLYKDKENQEISLYNIEIPKEINDLYPITKNSKFLFLYNNPEFEEKTSKFSGSENTKLIELLNNSRLDVKTKL